MSGSNYKERKLGEDYVYISGIEAYLDSLREREPAQAEQVIEMLREVPLVYARFLEEALVTPNDPDAIAARANISYQKNFRPEDSMYNHMLNGEYTFEELVEFCKCQHPEVYIKVNDPALSVMEFTEKIGERIIDDEMTNSTDVEINDYLIAKGYGIPESTVGFKIGEKAAHCELFSDMIEQYVNEMFDNGKNGGTLYIVNNDEPNTLFDASSSDNSAQKALYDELMEKISSLPAVSYGVLRSVAKGRMLPEFYNYSPEKIENESLAARFVRTLSDAGMGFFEITDANAALKYYRTESKNEPAKQYGRSKERSINDKIKEDRKEIERSFKEEKRDRASAKAKSDQRFSQYLAGISSQNKVLEHSFLKNSEKQYAKENKLLDKGYEKCQKKRLNVEKIRAVEFYRELTASEKKSLLKAKREMMRADAELERYKNKLIDGLNASVTAARYPEHTALRIEQIKSGDTTYTPLMTWEESKANGMYGYRAKLYEEDKKELFEKNDRTYIEEQRPQATTEWNNVELNSSINSSTRQSILTQEQREERQQRQNMLNVGESRQNQNMLNVGDSEGNAEIENPIV